MVDCWQLTGIGTAAIVVGRTTQVGSFVSKICGIVQQYLVDLQLIHSKCLDLPELITRKLPGHPKKNFHT